MTRGRAHPEHSIRCTWCDAPPGQRCTSRRGRHIAVPSYDARLTAWAARATTEPERTASPSERHTQ